MAQEGGVVQTKNIWNKAINTLSRYVSNICTSSVAVGFIINGRLHVGVEIQPNI
jgi:hypothetical protein